MPSRRPPASPPPASGSPEPRRDSYQARLAALRSAAPTAPTSPRTGDTYAESSGLTTAASGLGSSASASRSLGEGSASGSRSSSHSYIDYGAPTPYNTFIESSGGGDYSPTTSHSPSVYVGRPTESYVSGDYDYEPPPQSRRTYGDHLSPSSSRRESDFEVPRSSRPVPGPPQQIRSVISSDGSELVPVISPETTRTTSTPDPSHHPGRIKTFLARRSSKTVVDRDTLRLQQLGYDAVLGRDYTFWSSLAIAWLNINSVQVSVGRARGKEMGRRYAQLEREPKAAVAARSMVATPLEVACNQDAAETQTCASFTLHPSKRPCLTAHEPAASSAR